MIDVYYSLNVVKPLQRGLDETYWQRKFIWLLRWHKHVQTRSNSIAKIVETAES